jgi:hypothetical protein
VHDLFSIQGRSDAPHPNRVMLNSSARFCLREAKASPVAEAGKGQGGDRSSIPDGPYLQRGLAAGLDQQVVRLVGGTRSSILRFESYQAALSSLWVQV